MCSDVVYRLTCCGHSITVRGTPNGDEAFAEKEVSRCLSELCKCSRAPDTLEKREMHGYGYAMAPAKTIPMVHNMSKVLNK